MAEDAPPLRVVLVGWGAIGQAVAGQIVPDRVAIVGVAVRRIGPSRPPLPVGAELITDPKQLAALRPDVVLEAADRSAVAPWGAAAVDVGADFVVSSVSAFADEGTLDALRDAATDRGVRIEISPGALAGVDALSAASVLGLDSVDHRIVKPPLAWAGTPAELSHDLGGLETATVLLRATATEVARQYPRNANVAMTTALAGLGPDATMVTLVADPDATSNRHEIRAAGAFGRMSIDIENATLPDNPKTSTMAALSLVRSLRNRTSAVAI